MRGYKVFNPDWTCRGFQYEVGKTYEMEDKPECCKVGFHFCEELIDCFNYYPFNPSNKVAIVEALGDIDEETNDSKCCTNKIKIVEELSWEKVFKIGNTGKNNNGVANIGKNNNGESNIGKYNYFNRNTGFGNIGYHNCGNTNSGQSNTGNNNLGSCNCGDGNFGHCNNGDANIGNFNIGDFNSCDGAIGCFNTAPQKIYFFNKPSDMTYEAWVISSTKRILAEMPIKYTKWIPESHMTEEEKKCNPEYKKIGGYLKETKATNEERQNWYKSLGRVSKNLIIRMPNFDRDIFKEITGIDVCEV
ncbi:MAG: pentapeptide repeat-containing protein [Catonella sp.]